MWSLWTLFLEFVISQICTPLNIDERSKIKLCFQVHIELNFKTINILVIDLGMGETYPYTGLARCRCLF